MIAATMFSGIGAPEQAMPGWDWKWHAEIEKFPNAVMAHHHPNSINLGDVNEPDFVERAIAAGRPDVLVFGSPCQSFSVAGRRLGLDDPRGNLALVALGIVARIKPRWIVYENVPGLLSSSEGRDFGLFLRTVDELGYCGAWCVLDAQYAGVAQRRERVFFVGHAGDWRGPAAILLESESLCGNSPPRRSAGQRAAPTIEARSDAGGAGWGTDFLAGGGLAVGIGGDDATGHALTGKQQKRWDPHQETHVIETCPTLRSGGNQTGGDRPPGTDVDTADSLIVTPDIAWALQERDHKGADSDTKEGHLIVGSFQQNSMSGRGTLGWSPDGEAPLRPIKPQADHQFLAFSSKDHKVIPVLEAGARTGRVGHEERDGLGIGEPGDPMFTLQGSKQHAVAFSHQRHGSSLNNGGGKPGQGYPAVFKPSHYTRDKDGAPSDVCPPLTKETDKGDQDPLLLTSAVRRLTPRECERLQGYPDDYTLIAFRGKPAADGPRYKALGNSMAVPVMRWILSRVEAVDALLAAPSTDI